MRSISKAMFVAGLAGLASLMLPAVASAVQTYTYSGGLVDLSFTTSLSGAALDNLPAGTDITSTLGPAPHFVITGGRPAADDGSFTSADWAISSDTVLIGTDGAGDITSWNITGTYFVSYPVFPGENPFDFYGLYDLTLSSGGDFATLTSDQDVGLAPGSASSVAGTFTPSSTSTPEPACFALVGVGLFGLVMRLNKRQA